MGVPSDSLAALVPPDNGGYLYWRRGLLNKRKPMLGKIGWRGEHGSGGAVHIGFHGADVGD
ncbi:MAG: hypothetical protein IKU71_06310, partial [Kiritimatiellae bacterium]|nr:hypothetical protein [Kiritimatiellia bacterium]